MFAVAHLQTGAAAAVGCFDRAQALTVLVRVRVRVS